jgi:sedoheptulokinase
MNCTIGVDIGSSSIKAVLFAPEIPKVLKSENRPLNSRVLSLPLGRFEENPISISDLVLEVLSVLAQYARENDHKIKAIALTGQMHGGLMVDEKLKPLKNFITWQDKRGDEIAASGKTFADELAEISVKDPTGAGIHTGFLITTMYWYHKTNTPIPSNENVKILGIYDWLTSILVGRAVTDISSAAAWGCYDPILLEWRSDLLAAASIDPQMLPEVAEPGAELGKIDKAISQEIGLDADVGIYGSIGDTQGAYLGSECKTDEVLINIGTGSQSMWEMPRTAQMEATEGTDIRYLRDGRYIACAPTLAGGEAYRLVCDFFRETVRAFAGIEITDEDAFSTMNRIAQESSSHGLTFDPIFQGSKFRGDLARGAINGISVDNFHPGQLARALVEGMIEEVARPFFASGEKANRVGLVGAGGAIRRNSALRRVAEERFSVPLRLGRFDDEAAVGAAMLCGR